MGSVALEPVFHKQRLNLNMRNNLKGNKNDDMNVNGKCQDELTPRNGPVKTTTPVNVAGCQVENVLCGPLSIGAVHRGTFDSYRGACLALALVMGHVRPRETKKVCPNWSGCI